MDVDSALTLSILYTWLYRECSHPGAVPQGWQYRAQPCIRATIRLPSLRVATIPTSLFLVTKLRTESFWVPAHILPIVHQPAIDPDSAHERVLGFRVQHGDRKNSTADFQSGEVGTHLRDRVIALITQCWLAQKDCSFRRFFVHLYAEQEQEAYSCQREFHPNQRLFPQTLD